MLVNSTYEAMLLFIYGMYIHLISMNFHLDQIIFNRLVKIAKLV